MLAAAAAACGVCQAAALPAPATDQCRWREAQRVTSIRLPPRWTSRRLTHQQAERACRAAAAITRALSQVGEHCMYINMRTVRVGRGSGCLGTSRRGQASETPRRGAAAAATRAAAALSVCHCCRSTLLFRTALFFSSCFTSLPSLSSPSSPPELPSLRTLRQRRWQLSVSRDWQQAASGFPVICVADRVSSLLSCRLQPDFCLYVVEIILCPQKAAARRTN